ncbi:MAG TPA: hypothetical protein VGC55_02705 [Dokdonella sp.]
MLSTRRIFVPVLVIAVFAAAVLWWRQGDAPPPHAAATSERPAAAAAAPSSAVRDRAAPSVPGEPSTAQTPESRERATAAPVHAPLPTPPPPKATTQPTPAALAAMLDAPIDRNHAIDLFAEYLAKLDQGGGDNAMQRESAQRLQAFAAHADGGDDSLQVARELQTHLQDSLSQFSSERANHLALISVECKVGACQVLLAESAIDSSSAAGRAAMDLKPTLTALAQTRWWQQLGLALVDADMALADGDADGVPRYALWTIHLSVASAG